MTDAEQRELVTLLNALKYALMRVLATLESPVPEPEPVREVHYCWRCTDMRVPRDVSPT